MDQYANLKLKVDSTDVDEAERELNDLTKAGARAEKATDSLAASSKKFSKQTKQTTGNVRLMKGGVQQLGFQVQDIAVQLQGGTNAMVVLGQQGSQIASLFGPAGAIAGAVLAIGAAVGGTLVKGIFDAKSATDTLEESLAFLDLTVKETEGGVISLTKRVDELAKVNGQAASVEIKAGIVAALDAISASAELASEKVDDFLTPGFLKDSGLIIKAFKDISSQQRSAGDVVAAFFDDNSRFQKIAVVDARDTQQAVGDVVTSYLNLALAVERLEENYGASRQEAVAMAQAFALVSEDGSLSNLQRLQSAVDGIADNSGASDKIVKFAADLRTFTQEAEEAGAKSEKLNELLSQLEGGEDVSSDSRAFTALKERLEEQVALYGSVSLEAQILHKIESGRIKDLKDGQGDVLLGLARELDLKKSLAEAEKERKREADRLAAKQKREAEALEKRLEREAEREKVAQERSFERTRRFLLSEEEVIKESHDNRRDIILANTQKGSELQQQLLERLNTKTSESMQKLRDGVETEWESLAQGTNDILTDFLIDPFEDGLGGLVESFSKMLLRLQAEKAASGITDFLFGEGSSEGKQSGAGLLSGIGGFLGFKDAGGHIGAGQFAVVGERRPELVTGPANVIGGAETAKLMNSNNSNTTNININYSGTGNKAEDRRAAGAFARDINNRIDSGRRYG